MKEIAIDGGQGGAKMEWFVLIVFGGALVAGVSWLRSAATAGKRDVAVEAQVPVANVDEACVQPVCAQDEKSGGERMKETPADAFDWVMREVYIPTLAQKDDLRRAYLSVFNEGAAKGARTLGRFWPDGARWPSGETYLRSLGWRPDQEIEGDDEYEYSGPSLMGLLFTRVTLVGYRIYRDERVRSAVDPSSKDFLAGMYTHLHLNKFERPEDDLCGYGTDKIISIEEGLGHMENPAHPHPACHCTIDLYPIGSKRSRREPVTEVTEGALPVSEMPRRKKTDDANDMWIEVDGRQHMTRSLLALCLLAPLLAWGQVRLPSKAEVSSFKKLAGETVQYAQSATNSLDAAATRDDLQELRKQVMVARKVMSAKWTAPGLSDAVMMSYSVCTNLLGEIESLLFVATASTAPGRLESIMKKRGHIENDMGECKKLETETPDFYFARR